MIESWKKCSRASEWNRLKYIQIDESVLKVSDGYKNSSSDSLIASDDTKKKQNKNKCQDKKV